MWFSCVFCCMSAAGTITWNGWGAVRTGSRDVTMQSKSPEPWQRPHDAGIASGVRRSAERAGERYLDADWQVVVRRCLDGDSLAWTELVKAHHRRVYGLCYRFTGSAQDAEDLAQDVFLKIYGNLAAFDLAKGSFQTWITTLTRNLLVDHFRRSKQQRVTDSIDAGWEESDEQKMSAPGGG